MSDRRFTDQRPYLYRKELRQYQETSPLDDKASSYFELYF